MDKKLAAKVKKYNISLTEHRSTYLNLSCSAQILIKQLTNFLTANRLEDADILMDTGYDNNYLEFEVTGRVTKTEEELRAEVERYEQREEEVKKKNLENKKKQEEAEKKQYERLKKKYG